LKIAGHSNSCRLRVRVVRSQALETKTGRVRSDQGRRDSDRGPGPPGSPECQPEWVGSVARPGGAAGPTVGLPGPQPRLEIGDRRRAGPGTRTRKFRTFQIHRNCQGPGLRVGLCGRVCTLRPGSIRGPLSDTGRGLVLGPVNPGRRGGRWQRPSSASLSELAGNLSDTSS
jgi:hypothetical protein